MSTYKMVGFKVAEFCLKNKYKTMRNLFLWFLTLSMILGRACSVLHYGDQHACYLLIGDAWYGSLRIEGEKLPANWDGLVHIKSEDSTASVEGYKVCEVDTTQVCSPPEKPPSTGEIACWCNKIGGTESKNYDIFVAGTADLNNSYTNFFVEFNCTAGCEKVNFGCTPYVFELINANVILNENVNLINLKESQYAGDLMVNDTLPVRVCVGNFNPGSLVVVNLMVNGEKVSTSTSISRQGVKDTCLDYEARAAEPGGDATVMFDYEELGNCKRTGSYEIVVGSAAKPRESDTQEETIGNQTALVKPDNIGLNKAEMSRVSTSLLGTVVVLAAGFCL